jgi:AcrR family transcriptional regulator
VAQVNRQDWINAGINQLRSEGPAAISGEKLARRLDVTRGSFYHHFRNMDEFVEQVMDEWESTHTRTLLVKAHDLAKDPAAEMAFLLEAAWNADVDLEIAVRQWAFSHEGVRQRVEKVDATRLTHLTQLYGQLIGNPVKGAKFGKIAYFGLLGAMHAWPRPPREQLRRLILEIQELLLTGL